MSTPLPADPAVAAFGASLTAITLAELGDKTFFKALILAARHRARDVFIGAFGALTAVTLLSRGLGYGLREPLPPSVVPWLAAALFLGFGVKLLIDAQRLRADEAEEETDSQMALPVVMVPLLTTDTGPPEPNRALFRLQVVFLQISCTAPPSPGSLTARMPTALPVVREMAARRAMVTLTAAPEPVFGGRPLQSAPILSTSPGATEEPPTEARATPMRLPELRKGLVRVVVSAIVPLWLWLWLWLWLRLMAPPAAALPQIASFLPSWVQGLGLNVDAPVPRCLGKGPSGAAIPCSRTPFRRPF